MNMQRKKNGFILHEAMMAVGLAMALIVGATQLLLMATQQRRLARQYTIAAQEAGNLMEHVVSRAWENTTPEKLASIALPDTCTTHLPGADLSVEVADEDNATKRITIAIQWQSAHERAPDSVRLVGWKLLAGEDEP